jgi:hypothetical protein
MRLACAVLVTVLVALLFDKALAAPPFADSICPQATQYVMAAGRLRNDDPPPLVYDAAHAASEAYALCSKEKLSNGLREPQHYADTRAAAFAVLAARALIAMGRLDDARRELERWRAFAQQVVDWRSETFAYQSADVNGTAITAMGDNRRSLYYASAREIVAAIDVELDTIAGRSRDVARPQAKSTPPPSQRI